MVKPARIVYAYLIKFLVLIRGVRTPPLRIEDPVRKMPLQETIHVSGVKVCPQVTYHPAPRTLRPMQRPTPREPQTKGLVSSRKRPTLNA